MIVLGIDPGFTAAGFAVIKKTGHQSQLIECGFLATPSSKHLSERVGIFYQFFLEKIKTHNVTDIALETPFLGKNAQNFLKLGYLRGILYLLAHQHGITLHEFAPREVKLSLTGFGGASKEQVSRVILQLFPKLSNPNKYDVTDALAITLCGLWRNKNTLLYK